MQASLENAPKLDILVVPGPPPTYQASDAVKEFIKSVHASGADVLSICSGILPVAASGILDGKVGTGPLGIIPMLRQFFPAVKWEGTRRWEKTGGESGARLYQNAPFVHQIPAVQRRKPPHHQIRQGL